MSLKEFILWQEITVLLELLQINDQKTLLEIFQQPQINSKNSQSQVQDLKNWWGQWTDPRTKIEAAKRQVQAVLNIIGRDGIVSTSGDNQELVNLLTDVRAKLMKAYHRFPDPNQRAKFSTPQLNYALDTSKSSKL